MSDSPERDIGHQLLHLGRMLEEVREESSQRGRELTAELKKFEKRFDAQDSRILKIEEAEKFRANRLAEVYELAKKTAEESRHQAGESAEHRGQVIGHISRLETDLKSVAMVNREQNVHLTSMSNDVKRLVEAEVSRGERERVAEIRRRTEDEIRTQNKKDEEEKRLSEERKTEKRDKTLTRASTILSILVVVVPILYLVLSKFLTPTPPTPQPVIIHQTSESAISKAP